jgi:hypothetical protein
MIEVLKQTLESLKRSCVLTTREKIEYPEVTDWYNNSIADLCTVIAEAEKRATARAAIETMIDTSAKRRPLTQEQIESGRRASWGFNSDYFTAGVRFAEAAHRIEERK